MAFTSYRNQSVGALATVVSWGTGTVGFFGLWLVCNAQNLNPLSRADRRPQDYLRRAIGHLP